jgi:NAD(P)-dependent dehydrogenase (short-subunit alcohol dehydrogenase family)
MLLMTGATGTVGREVVTRLSAQGLEVRAVTRDLRHEDLESMHRAFLLTHSTARAEAQQTTFTRVAHQSGVRHLVELAQFAGRRARVGPLPPLSDGGQSGTARVRPRVYGAPPPPVQVGPVPLPRDTCVPTRLARDGAAAGQADQAGRAIATNPRPRKAHRP